MRPHRDLDQANQLCLAQADQHGGSAHCISTAALAPVTPGFESGRDLFEARIASSSAPSGASKDGCCVNGLVASRYGVVLE